jgi:hypothetical protein
MSREEKGGNFKINHFYGFFLPFGKIIGIKEEYVETER